MFPHERSLVDEYAHRPFAIIGVNSDRDKKRLWQLNEEHRINWRSFWCGPRGPSGPIPEKWNVSGWPTLYLIDHKGIIRHKNLRRKDLLDATIAKLVNEAETDLEKSAQDTRPTK